VEGVVEAVDGGLVDGPADAVGFVAGIDVDDGEAVAGEDELEAGEAAAEIEGGHAGLEVGGVGRPRGIRRVRVSLLPWKPKIPQ